MNVSKLLVAAGKYQFAIIIPENLTERVNDHALQIVLARFSKTKTPENIAPVPEIKIWFDPTVHGSFRSAVNATVNSCIQTLQTQSVLRHTLEQLPAKIAAELPPMASSYLSDQTFSPEQLLPDFQDDPSFITVQEQFATEMGFVAQPTAVQQNVPAWAIFGLFFLAVPLAGSLIHEERNRHTR